MDSVSMRTHAVRRMRTVEGWVGKKRKEKKKKI